MIIGLTGIAVTPLSPQGTVKVRGELWRARTGDESIEAGEEIKVQEVHELKLMVQRKPGLFDYFEETDTGLRRSNESPL